MCNHLPPATPTYANGGGGQMIDRSVILESITCPITQLPMIDPVQGSDGQTYERQAISEWIAEKGTSPQTREPMCVPDLKVNASVRYLCDKYHAGDFGPIHPTDGKETQDPTNDISLDHEICKGGDDTKLMISFNINTASFPQNLLEGHLPQDIVLVIDRSGSMSSPVEAQDEEGKNLESGMSIQDIVNHAAKTVAKTLNKNSRLSIIAFDDCIEVVFDLMAMTDFNQSHAIAKIDTIQPRNQTNIWGGIEKAIEILDTRDDKGRNGAIMLLTDGCPNISPARGEVETLKKLRLKKNFTSPIYTFGFGYNLRRGMLYDIAKYANGGTGHISDGGMIATVFCNFTATVLTTVAMNLQLHIKAHTPFTREPLMGDYASSKSMEPNFITYDLGTVQYQQSRDIVLNVDDDSSFEYYYTYKAGGQSFKSDTHIVRNISEIPYSPTVQKHTYRYMVVETIREMMNLNRTQKNEDAMKAYSKLSSTLTSLQSQDPLICGLIQNLVGDHTAEGQIKLAISNMTYFQKWGEFYIDQLSRAMNQQMKPNFKDAGCPFGGDLFEALVDKASDIFDSLPPPVPSRPKMQGGTSRPVNMAAFNNAMGGCFDSGCTITMADGSVSILKNLKKGHEVMSVGQSNNITSAKVVCVFETKIKSGMCELVEFDDGLRITPWHPIKYDHEWVFPSSLKSPKWRPSHSIITLVLDSHHIGFINGVQCVMLGHGFTHGILHHPYYGTQAVINDLKMNYGWHAGHVVVNDSEVTYTKDATNIVKMEFTSTEMVQ